MNIMMVTDMLPNNPIKPLAIFVLCLSPIVCAASELPATAMDVVKRACPKWPDRSMSAIGDLNGDKLPDAAILIGCESLENEELMVLHGQRDGSYQIAFRSQAWGWNGRSEKELEIRRGTVLLSEHCAYNCNPESWRSRFTFATRHNRFILVGEDHVQTNRTGQELEVENEFGTSINYLTRKAITWSKRGKRGYSEHPLSIKWTTPIEFTDFNLDSCQINRSCMGLMPAPENEVTDR